MHLMAAELQNFTAFGAPGREDINKQINLGQVPSKNSGSLALQGTSATQPNTNYNNISSAKGQKE